MRGATWCAVLAGLWWLGACSSTKTIPCETGDLRPCECDAGGAGTRSCIEGAFGACECRGDAGAHGEDASASGGPVLKGRVFDAESGRPVVGANVENEAGKKTQTGGDGSFSLAISHQAGKLSISRDDFARNIEIAPSEAAYIELFVKRLDAQLVFDAEEGVVARTRSGAALRIGPKAVRTADGKHVTGPVTLQLAQIDGKDREQVAALPGDMRARSQAGAAGQAATAGALHITLIDAEGKELDVDPKAAVVAELPVRESDASLERKSFSFDEGKQEWVEEGKAKRTVNDRGERVYRVDIAHLSWWAYGDFLPELACVRACAETGDEKPVKNAQVWLVGASFPGVQSAFTGDDGCLQADAPLGTELVLVAQAQDLVSKSKSFEMPSAAAAECSDAGVLLIDQPRSESCAAGYVECGTSCVDPATDTAHCGGCDNACAGGEHGELCVAGKCACASDQKGCGGELLCANVAQDSAACGKCGTSCDEAQECVSGGCVKASCPQGTERCGSDCVDVSASALHCGACGTVCAEGQQCAKGKCGAGSTPTVDVVCAVGFGDCDGDLSNGCEADLTTPLACGTCAHVCSAAHGSAGCQKGMCTVDECDAGFDDCDGDPSNGCEASLRSLSDCGGCGKSCSVAAGTPSCETGVCAVAACNTGFDDCDDLPGNGCETALGNNTHCSACDDTCSTNFGSFTCQNFACTLASCSAGHDDCDKLALTGCESDVSADPDHCGSCDEVCTTANGVPGCQNNECTVASCNVDHDDCDDDVANGCETDLTTLSDCGICDRVCAVAHGTPVCQQAGCAIESCAADFDDCDKQYANGCETDLRTINDCGSCDNLCTAANGTPACAIDGCEIGSCNSGNDDCDGQYANGCEVTLATNANHCGECGRNCASAGATCGSGMCSAVTIYSGSPYGSDNSGAKSWSFNGSAAFHIGYNSYTVDRMPVDGSGIVSVWAPTSKTGGMESVLATATAVFWAERGTPSVVLSKPHTALPSDLPTVAWTPAYQPTYLRLQSGYYYWASGDYQSGDPNGYIYRRAVSAPASDPGTRIVSVDQGNHGAIVAMAETTDAIYWVTAGVYNSNYQYAYYLHTTPLDGGTPVVIPVPTQGAVTGGFATGQVALRSSGNTLYFNVNVGTSFLNGIYKFTTNDTAPTQLVSAEDVMTMIIDANYIYFSQQNITGVWRAPIAGGAATKIANVNGTELIGEDATYLYMTSSSCCATSLLKIVK